MTSNRDETADTRVVGKKDVFVVERKCICDRMRIGE
jgi:hypothetical protein